MSEKKSEKSVLRDIFPSRDGFPSTMSVPPGWRARHRNLRVWRDELEHNLWFMEPLPEHVYEEKWTEIMFAGEEVAFILHRGRIDFLLRPGSGDIERRPIHVAKPPAEWKDGRPMHNEGVRGGFVDEETYRLSTGE